MKSTRITLQLLAAALLGAAFFATSASACTYPAGEQVFSPWGDPRAYALAPDGGFEAGAAGWTLEGGAAVVSGNESSYLNGPADSHSLSLPSGSAALSPPFCVSSETRFLRMMVSNAGQPGSRLLVETIYEGLGAVRTETVDGVAPADGWVPTQPLTPTLGLAGVDGAESAQVRIRPAGERGEWQVDDLYVDPFARY